MLNVWASWCGPCKEEAPFLEQVWQQNRDRGLVVVGSTRRTSAPTHAASRGRYELSFPLVYDGPGDTIDGYGVTGFPETFVIDREGRVVAAFAGAVNGPDERSRLESAVAGALS